MINITNPDEMFVDSLECPDPIIYLSDDELEYLQKEVWE